MENNFRELVDLYHQKKIEGMDFSQIRKELVEKNIEEDLIKDIVRAIDDRILRGEVKKKGKFKVRELRLIGWTLMIIGGIITLGTYFHWFDMKGYYFVSYGPVIAGYLLIIAARKAQRKEF
ncbi:hypothetical protein [Labilibaculum euxinus]|uniref:Uncharacterized protein n=1 Tax=Labilibaculum euxinus TaxID=2686357 RepID=A0A7M4D585_9BACT|nr:hypothetical protein [Labilibaculum euxinus]MUP37814.1 hypothetical protein [Labilibaculum euxinus]MVB07019.1 hypothetical protein [Labilibaculum euxinus]